MFLQNNLLFLRRSECTCSCTCFVALWFQWPSRDSSSPCLLPRWSVSSWKKGLGGLGWQKWLSRLGGAVRHGCFVLEPHALCFDSQRRDAAGPDSGSDTCSTALSPGGSSGGGAAAASPPGGGAGRTDTPTSRKKSPANNKVRVKLLPTISLQIHGSESHSLW